MPNLVNSDQFFLVRRGATLIKPTWHLVRLSRTIRQRPLVWVDPVRLIKPSSVAPCRAVPHRTHTCMLQQKLSQYYQHFLERRLRLRLFILPSKALGTRLSFNQRNFWNWKETVQNFQLCACVIMVRHGTTRHNFSSYKTEALQVELRSNSNSTGSARRGTTYKTGLIHPK